MTQEQVSIDVFFHELAARNDENNAYWGPAYREIITRIKRDNPDFSDSTIKDLWYTRDNGVSSLRQGGMSQEEFTNAKPDLIEITRLIASGCTPEIYQQAQERLKKLKSQGVLRKFYRALCDRVFAAFYPEHITSLINGGVFFRIFNFCKNRFMLPLTAQGSWLELNMALKAELNKHLGDAPDPIALNMALWHLYEEVIEEANNASMVEKPSNEDHEDDEDEQADESDTIIPPKNLILYGPPGTGKTFKTIEIAVRACDPKAYSLHDGKAPAERRKELKSIYDRLVKEKRVRFVTFHQSFGYEEFVEGLRAETNASGDVAYDIKPGIFKLICEDAAFGNADAQLELDEALEKFKAQCVEQNGVELKTANGNVFRVTYANKTTFRIFPEQSKNEQLERGYAASIENIRKLYSGDKEGVYNISYVRSILQHLIKRWNLLSDNKSVGNKKQNYVLIIDEINRGNISKIFGELITLIETSKRAGEKESLSVDLPYSGDSFSVPANLFIVGTMNTADRSLTALDTALRRRFEFEALLPMPKILENTVVKGINLEKLLTMLNNRIQVLYDSEHTLGHAFLIRTAELARLDENEAFKELKRVMKNKIIPLLEEYFYNDWQKIRLVLGDNQKTNQALQFIRSVENQTNLEGLFGLEAMECMQEAGFHYQLCSSNDKVWDSPLAWQQIYDLQARETEQL